MQWLNLQTRMLHAPEYIGVEPTARATWLNVSLWSAEQENSGVISGASSWSDRRWQQTCGVTAAEIKAAFPLITFEGDDVLVAFYPIGQQEIVTTKRITAQINGQLGGRPKKPTSVPALVPTLEPVLKPKSESVREGKVKEGKGRKQRVCFTPPSPSEVSAYSAEIGYTLDGGAWCDSYAQKGWMAGRNPMQDWRAAVRNWKANGWQPNRVATATGLAGANKHQMPALSDAEHAKGFFNGT